MKNSILSLIVIFILCCHTSFSQTLHNPQNVDRTATSYYNGLQTFRALEYTKDPDQQSEKVYRLQTLPENGFPAIHITGTDNGSTVYFEDKVPYDNSFADNPTPYLSAEAVQLHFSFQTAMKIFDQRFGWKGMDGTGADPIKISVENSDGTSKDYSYAYYSANINNKYFAFGKSFAHSTPLPSSIDIVAHELSHAIMQHKSNITYLTSLCTEYRSIDEGLADIFGIYVKNKFLQSTPQNYNWLVGEEISSIPKDISNPKSHDRADTYKGQYFDNSCSDSYNFNAGAGVAGKWFYLLSSGFTGTATNDLGYQYSNITGIGVEKAIQIIWNTIPNLKNTTDYPALRTLTLNATGQLHGINSTEYLAVQNAWCAVGVCDNGLPYFSLSPANAVSGVDPWPGVKVNFSWDNDPRVKKVEVQMSTQYDFAVNTQTIEVSNFDMLFKPGGGIVYTGNATGYFHPGETVYVRAKIVEADANFCRSLNPLCPLYQQYSPTHAFKLDNKKAQFWHAIPQNGFTVNAWEDPTIYWKSVANAEKYTFQVATDEKFSNLVYTGSTNQTGNFTESGIINAALETNKYYYLRVRAERNNSVKLIDNFGEWSKTDSVHAYMPTTSVVQALNQKPNDPATTVSSLGFGVDWYAAPGAALFLIQVATDELFTNVVRSQVAPGNQTNALITLPSLADQINLFVRVLPQKGVTYATCTNVWRVKTDKNATLLAMAGPDPKIPIPYKTYFGKIFKWNAGTVDLGLIDHFKVRVEEKGSGQVTFFNTPGKALEKEIVDQLMYDDHLGIDVSVLGVGPLGAETALSSAFSYTICQDQPIPKFPNDNDKIDPALPVTITWEPSLWQEPGEQYLVTILSNGSPVNGFNNTPTLSTSMLLPAGTLGNGKNYTLIIKNSGSCPGLDPWTVLFSTIAGANNNPPATPTKDLSIQLSAFRSDLDLSDPFPFENADYILGFELVDPNGNKIQVTDANGDQVSQLLVDSENVILGIFAKDQPVGKYALKLKMLTISDPPVYNLIDQPRFSVTLNGQTVINNHIITINPFDAFYDEWKVNFQFTDITLDHK